MEGGLSTLYSEQNSFSSLELKQYLYQLQEILSNDKLNLGCNLGFILSSNKHAMGMFYQPKRHIWTVMDINQWLPLEITSTFFPPSITGALIDALLYPFSENSLDKLNQNIQKGFGSTTKIICNIRLISSAREKPKLKQLYPMENKMRGFSFDLSPLFIHCSIAIEQAITQSH